MAKAGPRGSDNVGRSKSKTNISTEAIKAVMESAMQQNPIMFKRLAEI